MIQRIDRIAIAVKDLDRARDFFSDLFAVDFDEPRTHDALGMRGCYSACGLELIEPKREESLIGRFIQKRGEGLWALVLKVKDMEEAVRAFTAKGLRVAGEVRVGQMREVAFHPKESFGVEIVLAEYPEKHPATVAVMSGMGERH
jgi:catechol 2,3-dioxygenase-like lactoylglutathione lyase family enzyme